MTRSPAKDVRPFVTAPFSKKARASRDGPSGNIVDPRQDGAVGEGEFECVHGDSLIRVRGVEVILACQSEVVLRSMYLMECGFIPSGASQLGPDIC